MYILRNTRVITVVTGSITGEVILFTTAKNKSRCENQRIDSITNGITFSLAGIIKY